MIYLRICSFALLFSGFDIVAGLTVGEQLGCCMDHGWSGPWLDLRLKSAYWREDDLTLHDGFIVFSAMRVKMFVSDVDIFLNHDSELSHVAECQRYAPLFSPLLSELGLADDCTWWLLDSGASRLPCCRSRVLLFMLQNGAAMTLDLTDFLLQMEVL